MGSININVGFGFDDTNQGFKFKDLFLPIKLNDTKHDFRELLDYASIENSIRNLFEWKQGERIILPDYGNSLHKLLFEPINEITSKRIGEEIESMFAKYEPRVNITDVFVEADEDRNEYRIQITYNVPALSQNSIQLQFTIANTE